jgi:hypothetical protein
MFHGGRPTYEHLPTFRFRLIVDPTLVETLFSITPLPERPEVDPLAVPRAVYHLRRHVVAAQVEFESNTQNQFVIV